MKSKIDVAIIAGSGSDLPLISNTVDILKEFNLSYEVHVVSAHRTSEYLRQCVRKLESSGAKVFITAAGLSAALPGVVASETILPVIGIPVDGKNLASFDSLFSIVQMPKGVPVAAVAVGKAGAVNAALLAAQIIAVSDNKLKGKLKNYKTKMSREIINEDLKLQKYGIEKYIDFKK
jgi:5-(carboxyamino)imidazole ribonucleotide mutase